MTNLSELQMNDEWAKHLCAEFESENMLSLQAFLSDQLSSGITIYPPLESTFSAFNATPLSKVKVVILGQDPYHGEGQAHGLSFSVPAKQVIPPSLKNIYKEIEADLACEIPNHGNLMGWAEQGVFLLNSVLTVEKANAGSHRNKGWEHFTDAVIEVINRQCDGVVFMLWGSYAHKKGRIVDSNKHCVLQAPHPSPLSSYRGFFGCRHFSKANSYLQKKSKAPIDWRIS